MANKAVIVGASGLIGSKLLDILLQQDEYTEVLSLVRKELPVKYKKLTQIVVDFDKPETYAHAVTGCAIFSCLGTTKANTPDANVYYKIDHDYPVTIAKLGHKNGVEQFHIVSSMGADASSSIFYTRTKGEVERDLQTTGIKSISIYRPAMIIGDRKEKRFMEGTMFTVMKVVDIFLIGGLKKYRSIKAETIAQAMYNQSLKTNAGVFIYESDKIKQLA